MPEHFYFRAPRFNISEDSDTSPKLGSIFSRLGLKKLTDPLNRYDFVSVPSNLRNNCATVDFRDAVQKKLSVEGGLTADMLQGLVGSGNLSYAFDSDKNNVYSCEVLETTEFEPTKEFVADCIRGSIDVQNFIADSFFGMKRVYMIVGLMIATGFSTAASKSVEQGPKLRVVVDGSGFGVPVSGGPEVEAKFRGSRDVSYGPTSSKIVFAYRVIRIKPKGDGDVKYKDISGGQYGLGEDVNQGSAEFWDLEPLSEQDRLDEFADSEVIGMEHKG